MNYSNQHSLCFQQLSIFILIRYIKYFCCFSHQLIPKNTIYYIEATPLALVAIRFFFPRLNVIRLDFNLIDLKDDNGNLLRLLIGYKDLKEVQELIFTQHEIKSLYANNDISDYLDLFLKKQSVSFVYNQKTNIFRLLIMVYALRDHLHRSKQPLQDVKFIAFSCGWDEAVRDYIRSKNINIEFRNGGEWNFKDLLKNFLGDVEYRILYHQLLILKKCCWGSILSATTFPQKPMIAVDYYGQTDFTQQDNYSDLFFLGSGNVPSDQTVLLLNFPNDPLDGKRYANLKAHGVRMCGVHPQSSSINDVPQYFPKLSLTHSNNFRYDKFNVGSNQWVRKQLKLFLDEKNYWKKLFQLTHAKIYFNWFKYDASSCYRVEAIKELGGITAYFQRSFEPMSSIETALAVDVLFSYSKFSLEIEKQSGSSIPYGVIVGYPGIYQSDQLDKSSEALRHRLYQKGVRKIIAFFDENSGADSRWHTGHEFMRVNYEFILSRLLENKDLGLVLKPKVAATLRSRLGHTALLLEEALASERCVLLESENLYNTITPALAAKSADLAIHAHFCASTAGIESALTKTPTVLLDREGFSVCTLKKQWGNDIVYDDWHDLWKRIESVLLNEHVDVRFGNWDHIIDELDPYRDGKTRVRIAFYLSQLLEGFNRNLDRDAVLAYASEEFAKQWGKDKIIKI